MTENRPPYVADLVWQAEPSADSLGEKELAALRPYFGEVIRELLQAAEDEQPSE